MEDVARTPWCVSSSLEFERNGGGWMIETGAKASRVEGMSYLQLK